MRRPCPPPSPPSPPPSPSPPSPPPSPAPVSNSPTRVSTSPPPPSPQPIPFFQAVLTLYIDGFQKAYDDTPALEANINENLPYAQLFGINLGELFVLAGEIAEVNSLAGNHPVHQPMILA